MNCCVTSPYGDALHSGYNNVALFKVRITQVFGNTDKQMQFLLLINTGKGHQGGVKQVCGYYAALMPTQYQVLYMYRCNGAM